MLNFPPVLRLVLDEPKQWPPREIIDQIHELILAERRISAKSIAEQLGTSRGRVRSFIQEDLDMGKLSVKWVLKCLNAKQKRQSWNSSEQILEFFRRDPNDFLSRMLTMDETSLYHYDIDSETKQQSMEWRHSGSPRTKIFRVQKSAGKFFASIFWDQVGSLPIEYLPKGQTINAEFYWSLLVQLKDIFGEKCRGKATNVVSFLHENAMAHGAIAS